MNFEHKKYKIAVVATAPFYYHTPLYRNLNNSAEIDLTVYFCSDETLRGTNVKRSFNINDKIVGDDQLLGGYKCQFLKNYSFFPSIALWPVGLMNFEIWKEIKNGKYDAVILTAWTDVTRWMAFFACRKYNTPVLLMTDNNVLAERYNPLWKRLVKKVLLKYLFKNSAGFLAAGKANEQLYLYFGADAKKIVRMPFSWGYEELLEKSGQMESKRDEIRRSLGAGKDDFIILYVGRLSKEKLPSAILDSFSKINLENKKIILVGDGYLRKKIEKIRCSGLKLAGFQKREDLLSYYAAADLFIMPSKKDALPLAVNEAMCFGLPIIASDKVGSTADLIKDGYNGFVFPAGNGAKFIECIEKTCQSQQLCKIFGNRSREIISEWAKSVEPADQIIKLVNLKADRELKGPINAKGRFVNFIRKLSYNSSVIWIIRFFCLRKTARLLYYYWTRPRDNVLSVNFGAIIKFHVRNPEELRLAESVSGEWGEKDVIEALIRELKPGDCFYDVGANIGIYSVIVAKILKENGTVVAFEPEKESCIRLENNVALNKLKNLKIIKKALGERDETGKLYIGKTMGNYGLLTTDEKGVDFQDVQIINGDNFVKENNLPIPKAVKIDVEGYEYSVLSGLAETLKNPICKVVCIEVHPYLFPAGVTEETIFNFLKNAGFLKTVFFREHVDMYPYHLIAIKT